MSGLLVLEAGCLGTFMALDLLLFFLFFEIVLVPMYFLIGQVGARQTPATRRSSSSCIPCWGSAIMLVGIVSLVFLHASQTGSELTFDLVENRLGASRWPPPPRAGCSSRLRWPLP